jgi:hypothetical protein
MPVGCVALSRTSPTTTQLPKARLIEIVLIVMVERTS